MSGEILTITKKFNFGEEFIDGYISVMNKYEGNGIPMYSDRLGYGFVNTTCAIPTRCVDSSLVKQEKEACVITQKNASYLIIKDINGNNVNINTCKNYSFGGMVFRIKAPAGAYKIEVKTISGQENTFVAVSGMCAVNVERTKYWDAAQLVEVKHRAIWKGNTWTYSYANGQKYIDIEIEPKVLNTKVGIKTITLTTILPRTCEKNEKRTIFTLGDSTVKSYIFEEAPMSGWGQVFDDLFSLEKINVINYSAGGRSLKVMYIEGRLNDILLTGKPGDYIFIQSGHNDEKDGIEEGENTRFGRGVTEGMYKRYLVDIFIPAVRARKLIPMLVTPVTRVKYASEENNIFINSFDNRKFPDVMKQVAKEMNIPLIDLNKKSVEYFNEIGRSAVEAIVLSIEAGETPGKTNSGSYANGNPDNKIDGTHYKEALAKQYSRMVIEEVSDRIEEGNECLAPIVNNLKTEVKEALRLREWSRIFPEMCKDTTVGEGAYYRDQIEKVIQIGAMKKDKKGMFYPEKEMTIEEYIDGLTMIWKINTKEIEGYSEGVLTREIMAAIIYDAYHIRFKENPKYMTDYNGSNITPDNPQYDPNCVGKEAQYYPLVGYETISDIDKVSKQYLSKVKEVYKLGLIRSEKGISRGSMINGTVLEPKDIVTREKAAKSLYFMWVLSNSIMDESDNLFPKKESEV